MPAEADAAAGDSTEHTSYHLQNTITCVWYAFFCAQRFKKYAPDTRKVSRTQLIVSGHRHNVYGTDTLCPGTDTMCPGHN